MISILNFFRGTYFSVSSVPFLALFTATLYSFRIGKDSLRMDGNKGKKYDSVKALRLCNSTWQWRVQYDGDSFTNIFAVTDTE